MARLLGIHRGEDWSSASSVCSVASSNGRGLGELRGFVKGLGHTTNRLRCGQDRKEIFQNPASMVWGGEPSCFYCLLWNCVNGCPHGSTLHKGRSVFSGRSLRELLATTTLSPFLHIHRDWSQLLWQKSTQVRCPELQVKHMKVMMMAVGVKVF